MFSGFYSNKSLKFMHDKKVIEIFSEPVFSMTFLQHTVPNLMALLDSVYEQTAQIVLNHIENPMIM